MLNVLKHAGEDVVKMLLGNECYMAEERDEKIAIDHRIRFHETLAQSNMNIDKAFCDLAEAILC